MSGYILDAHFNLSFAIGTATYCIACLPEGEAEQRIP